jgi:hypothetical protein
MSTTIYITVGTIGRVDNQLTLPIGHKQQFKAFVETPFLTLIGQIPMKMTDKQHEQLRAGMICIIAFIAGCILFNFKF